jgi:hypothetical protein
MLAASLILWLKVIANLPLGIIGITFLLLLISFLVLLLAIFLKWLGWLVG